MPDANEKSTTNLNKQFFAEIGRKFKNFVGSFLLFGFAAALSLLLLLWLAGKVFEDETVFFDETIRQRVHQFAAPWFTKAMIFVSLLGSQRFLISGVIVFSIIFIWLKWKRELILLLVTMAGEAVLEITLKLIFHRLRPEPFFDYPPLKTYSFPSGHALASFCFYGILALLIAAHVKRRGLKFLIWISAATLVLFIGISRIYLGVHFPSDVAAGFAAGFVWIFTVVMTDYYLKNKNSQN
jgi:membrane-associated phospholipid phosphatase